MFSDSSTWNSSHPTVCSYVVLGDIYTNTTNTLWETNVQGKSDVREESGEEKMSREAA